MRITHFTQDEKFINGAMSTFELAFPGKNELYVLKPPTNPKIRFVDAKYITKEIVRNSDALSLSQQIVKSADWVIIHGMNEIWAQIILSNDTAKIVYVIWGAEVYSNPYLYEKNILAAKTKSLFEENSKFNLKKFLKDQINGFRFGKRMPKNESQNLNKSAIQKIENIAVLYKEELDVFYQNKILIKPVRHLKFGYYPFEFFMNQIDAQATLGDNILIGNSSSYSNNHLEILDQLKNFELENRKLVVPLSYGDNKLSKHIISVGKSFFQDNFSPILDFMPLSDYTKLVQSCNVVIMNHFRQQAVGNILSAVYLGAKIFLNKENSAYLYLKNLGCHVYEISLDLKTQDDLIGLTQEEINHNRAMLQKDMNQAKLVNHLRIFLN